MRSVIDRAERVLYLAGVGASGGAAGTERSSLPIEVSRFLDGKIDVAQMGTSQAIISMRSVESSTATATEAGNSGLTSARAVCMTISDLNGDVVRDGLHGAGLPKKWEIYVEAVGTSRSGISGPTSENTQEKGTWEIADLPERYGCDKETWKRFRSVYEPVMYVRTEQSKGSNLEKQSLQRL